MSWAHRFARLERRERILLALAMLLGLTIRVGYVVATRHYRLAGDAPEYDAEGQLIAAGHLFWTRLPYGILHAGAWKAPGYPAWVGAWYAVIGHHPTGVKLAQAVIGCATIALTWLLARRLFSPRVAIAAAFLVAIYPLVWQYDALLYPEALATPLTVAILIVIFTGAPTTRRAVPLGLMLGVALLLRPTSEFLVLGALAGWWAAGGWRRGIGLTALSVAVAVVVLTPWMIRNAVVMHGFVPISMQDSALSGTFNSTAAHDPRAPYAWRADPPPIADLFDPHHPRGDVELRAALIHRGESYISSHPSSLLGAFFWNGLSRLWDIRRRSSSLFEVPYEGRSRLVSEAGLDMYDVLLPLALIGLWRARRRRALVVGVAAMALGASVVFTVAAGTRYRATIEPLIAVMACAGVLGTGAPDCARASPL